MRRPSLRRLLLLLLVPAALFAAGCGGGAGGDGIQLAKSNPQHSGAEVFNQRCGACHTLKAAGTHGSSTDIGSVEYKDGPNFNARIENYQDVLYAIRNGGFSGQQMPANIVTGQDAEKVACFVAKYSGSEREASSDPGAIGKADLDGCEAKLGE
jgi:mono/diheme cytochrome c family protein